MDKDKINKLKEYALKNKNKVYALSNWININMKPFKTIKALECIYDYAKGNSMKMTDIIDHLTAKKKVYGRTQVYAGSDAKKMDIVDNGGTLVLTGYENADPLPLKGQRMAKNPNIFRKSDDQTKKNYQDTENRLYNIGSAVRKMWPNASGAEVALIIVAIRKYAQQKKLNTNKVIDLLVRGRLVLNDNNYTIYPIQNEQKTIIIDENTAMMIAEELEMTEYRFNSAVKSFLHDLLVDPSNAKPSDILCVYGYSRSKLLRYLVNYGIVRKNEKINDKDENGEPKSATMKVRYTVPKKNFDRKLKRLYIRLFEKNVPSHEGHIDEDGEAGGATGSDASGQYSQPLFGVQRRSFGDVEEATTTSTVGDYQYTVPFGGDKETLKRKNGVGGSVSINHV